MKEEHRTLEQYKEEVFDKLDEQTKLEWLYIMSEQLCNIEEYILTHKIYDEVKFKSELLKIIGGNEYEI